MPEYIERKAAVNYVAEKAREVLLMSGFDFPVRVYYKMAVAHAVEDLKFMPSADVVEVRHGAWIHRKTYYEADECDCSLCGQPLTTAKGIRKNYCPNCGAKMDGKVV